MSTSEAIILLYSKVRLISCTTVEGALFGFAFGLYTFCARSLYLQLKDQDRRRQHLFTLLYMSLVMILAFIGDTVDARDAQASWVDHADYQGGGISYSGNVFAESTLAIVGYVIMLLFSIMTSGIQIWRLWVIWRVSRYSVFVVILPVLALLVFIGLQVLGIIQAILPSDLDQRLNKMMLYGNAIAQLYISVFVTVLITGRILMIRKQNMKLMGKNNVAGPYTSIIAMLIESFALESAWIICKIISSPGVAQSLIFYLVVVDFFVLTEPYIRLLAYLLVVHRVTMGREWKEDTAEKLTTLEWNRDGSQTTQIGTQTSIPMAHEEA